MTVTHEQFWEAYSQAKKVYRNAQEHLAAVERRLRRRLKQVHAAHTELAQQEAALPRLRDELENAKTKLVAAREAYRPLREQAKAAISTASKPSTRSDVAQPFPSLAPRTRENAP